MQSIIKLQKIATHVSLGLNPFKVHTFTSNSIRRGYVIVRSVFQSKDIGSVSIRFEEV